MSEAQEKQRETINKLKSQVLDHVTKACSIEDNSVELAISEGIIRYAATIEWDREPFRREVIVIIREGIE